MWGGIIGMTVSSNSSGFLSRIWVLPRTNRCNYRIFLPQLLPGKKKRQRANGYGAATWAPIASIAFTQMYSAIWVGSAEIHTRRIRSRMRMIRIYKDGWERSRLCHFVKVNFEGLEILMGLASSSCALAQATPWSLECAPVALSPKEKCSNLKGFNCSRDHIVDGLWVLQGFKFWRVSTIERLQLLKKLAIQPFGKRESKLQFQPRREGHFSSGS